MPASRSSRRFKSVRTGGVFLTACVVVMGMMGGCPRMQKFMQRNDPVPAARASTPVNIRDIPSPLRGTIGGEATIIGNEATLVSGIGFVVGLNGTGGLTIPEQYAAHLEREMSLNGVSIANDNGRSPISGRSPRALLQDPNTAAVIVQAAIPPGAQAGEKFDLYVRAINATSLEGGKLWSTEMRIGPPSSFGNPQARIIAAAKGPIFLNPFAEPGGSFDGITRDVGRVLNGGTVTFPTEIQIVLDNPSHQRARLITSAINSAFPMRPGDREPTARGKDESLVLVRVPAKFRDRHNDFINLLSHITIDQSYPELFARRYAMTLKSDPYLASDMSWCLQALGERSVPFLQDLYDTPEAAPRLSALRAGAGLDDPQAAEYLQDIAVNGPENLRTDAIALMSQINGRPAIDRTLRKLLESEKLSIRIEAYEGLIDRAINARKRQILNHLAAGDRRPGESPDLTLDQVDVLANTWVPTDPIRGIGRQLVAGKFFLDIVPFGEPLIYITQQDIPRIVLFGKDMEIKRPLLASAWSDRLMLTADSATDDVRLYYRDDATRRTTVNNKTPTAIPELVKFLANEPNAGGRNTGLGFSYSQVVGALYELYDDDGISAYFTTEQDRLLADLLASATGEEIEIRPDNPNGDTQMVPINDPQRPVLDRSDDLRSTRRTLLVPVNPPSDEDDDEAE